MFLPASSSPGRKKASLDWNGWGPSVAVPAFPWHQQCQDALSLCSFSQGVPDLRDISGPWLQEQGASSAQVLPPPCRFGQKCTPGSPRGQAAASRHEEISQWKHCSLKNHFFSSSCEMHGHFFPLLLKEIPIKKKNKSTLWSYFSV